MRHAQNKVIFCDVDGTLVVNGKLNQAMLDRLFGAVADGWEVYLWSARGKQHCIDMAQKHGFDGFDGCLTKPGIIFDDKGKEWDAWTHYPPVPR